MRIGIVKYSDIRRTGRLDAGYYLSDERNEMVWEAADRMGLAPEQVREQFDMGALIVRDGKLTRP